MTDLSGNVALITGASGDIGRAIAISLHAAGAHVVITGTNLAKLEKLAQQLQTRCDVKACNLADHDQCSKLLNELEKIDILVCNAGVTADNLAIKMTDQVFSEVIEINLTANFILNREAIKKMMRNRYGRIINITSVVAVTGNPGQVNYSASKAGLIGMTKSLSQEVATRGITVNTVAPGFIISNMTSKLSDAQKELIKQKIPMKTFGTPEDVANVVKFLASKETAYITGQTIHVNGGMLMV